MRKVKNYLLYLATALLWSLAPVVSGFAHEESGAWGHHMMGPGYWGWGPMILFWLVGLLVIALLIVTLTKTLKD